jgi:hypothetical protein
MRRRPQRRAEPSWKTEQFAHLKSLNQKGRLALFIGAGISHGCGLPGWEALVQGLAPAAFMGGKASVRDVLVNFNTITQIRIIKARLKSGFNRAIANVLYASQYQLSPALDAIATAGARRICTFNFDDLIEEALGMNGLAFRSLAPGDPLDAKFEGTIVAHPHGFLTASMTAEECAQTQIVFSEEDYHDLYGNPYSWANLIQLSLLLWHSCLFVGTSLTDPSIRRLLDSCAKLPIAHKHYAIMRSPASGSEVGKAGEDLQFARNAELRSLGVDAIWINSFDEVETIFHRIRARDST